MLPRVTEMVQVPAALAVTTPAEVTVAMDGSLLLQTAGASVVLAGRKPQRIVSVAPISSENFCG